MKKFFLFAAVFAAMTVNAASFTGFDARGKDLGDQIHDQNLIQNQNNIVLNETDATAHKYEIKLDKADIVDGSAVSTECSFTMGGITFWYSNSNDGTVAYKTYLQYIQPNGNKRKVIIPTTVGEKVRIYAIEACNGVAVEGVTGGSNIDLVAMGEDCQTYTELTAKSTSIVLWSDKRDASFTATKFKLSAILPVSTEGVENVNSAVKAEKFFRDGQLIIRKNGVEYNALGEKL